jgi:hypothetical protein
MDRIKKEVNDSNKEVIKELSYLYNKLSDCLDKSYYYGQKSGYEEILAWFKQSQNTSVKYISPNKIKNYLIEKGIKSKILLNEKTKNNNIDNYKEEIKKKPNRATFNYLFYNQTFSNDSNNIRNNNEQNVFPISVEQAFSNNNAANKANNPFNHINFNNNNNGLNNINEQNEHQNHQAILSNTLFNNSSNVCNNNNCFIRNDILGNNNLNDSQDEQMKPSSPLRTNIFPGSINLKRKKNS